MQRLPVPIMSMPNQQRIAAFLDHQVALIDHTLTLRRRQNELLAERLEANLRRVLASDAARVWVPLRRRNVRVTTGPFGTAFSASEYVDGGVPMINPLHIRDGGLVPEAHVSVAPEVAARLSRFALRQGDLIVSRKGDIGRSALVGPDSEGWICGSDSIALRLAGSSMNPNFTWHLLRLPEVRGQLSAQSLAATMPSLNEGNLLTLRVPDLPQSEQADLADHARDLVETHRAARGLLQRSDALLEERKQALIAAAVSGQFDMTTARSVT